MDGLSHVFKQVLAAQPFVPRPSLNDDDLYVVDLKTMQPVTSYGCASATARDARYSGVAVRPGQALLKGMQLRHMQGSKADGGAA